MQDAKWDYIISKPKSNLNIYFLLNQSSKISKYDPQIYQYFIYPQKIYHSYIPIWTFIFSRTNLSKMIHQRPIYSQINNIHISGLVLTHSKAQELINKPWINLVSIKRQQVRRSVDFHEKAYLWALSVAIRIIHVWHFTVATGSLPREAGKQKWKATSPSWPVENAYLHSIFQQWAPGLSEAMHLSRPVLWGTFTSAGDIGCLLDLALADLFPPVAIFTETKFTEWAEPIPVSEVHPPCSRGAIVPEPADGDQTMSGGGRGGGRS